MRDAGAAVDLDGVARRFGVITAVDDVRLHLRPGSFTALLGPSGCGKSTLLAMIAGLLAPESGEIRIDATSVNGIPTERRPVSMLFQKPLLFPHLNVGQNVAFGLRLRGLGRGEVRGRVEAMLAQVQLTGLSSRRVTELSGGQEQRVALARALVLEPRVLLLDEPFSQLDTALRTQMRALVRQLHDRSGVTTLFVTHDQSEAVDVADDIALMLQGRLAGHAPPRTFYTAPPSLDAARFFGVTNELPGEVRGGRFTAAGLSTSFAAWPNGTTGGADGPAVLVVRPESIDLTADSVAREEIRRSGNDEPDATVRAVAVGARFAGTHLAVELRLPIGTTLTAHVGLGTYVDLGSTMTASWPVRAGTVFTQSIPAQPVRDFGGAATSDESAAP